MIATYVIHHDLLLLHPKTIIILLLSAYCVCASILRVGNPPVTLGFVAFSRSLKVLLSEIIFPCSMAPKKAQNTANTLTPTSTGRSTSEAAGDCSAKFAFPPGLSRDRPCCFSQILALLVNCNSDSSPACYLQLGSVRQLAPDSSIVIIGSR